MDGPKSARIIAWVAAILFGLVLASVLVLSDLRQLRDERADLEQLLESTSAGWVEASEEFFRPPAAAARLIEHTVAEGQAVDLEELLLAIGLDADIDAAFVGFPDGAFHFAARDGDTGFRTRVIGHTVDGTELQRLDHSFQVLDMSIDADDAYDPRARPWFEPITQGADQHWSSPYTFASSGEPGITYSIGSRAPSGELIGVVGIDVRLTALVDFLGKLEPGDNGIAAILNADGELVASSAEEVESADQLPVVEALGQAASQTAATSRFDDGRIATTQTIGDDNEWVLVAVAQEADFLTSEHRTWVHLLRFATFFLLGTILGRGVGRPIIDWFSNIYRRANLDELTGLATRAAFTDDLARFAADESQPIAVAIIDLDRFKPINDTWGHDRGDAALQLVASRIGQLTEAQELQSARLGGDEFVIVATGTRAREADELWDTLIDELNRPIRLDDRDTLIGASMGVTFSPEHTTRSVESLLRAADSALYQAKHAGGGCWRASHPEAVAS